MHSLLHYFRLSQQCNRTFVVYPETPVAGAGTYQVRLSLRSKRVYTIYLDDRGPDSCGVYFFKLSEQSKRYFPVRFGAGAGDRDVLLKENGEAILTESGDFILIE